MARLFVFMLGVACGLFAVGQISQSPALAMAGIFFAIAFCAVAMVCTPGGTEAPGRVSEEERLRRNSKVRRWTPRR